MPRVVAAAGDLAFPDGFAVPEPLDPAAGAEAPAPGPGNRQVEVEVDVRQLGRFVVEPVEKDLASREPVAVELQQGADVIEMVGKAGVGKAVEAVAVARVEGADLGQGPRRERTLGRGEQLLAGLAAAALVAEKADRPPGSLVLVPAVDAGVGEPDDVTPEGGHRQCLVLDGRSTVASAP